MIHSFIITVFGRVIGDWVDGAVTLGLRVGLHNTQARNIPVCLFASKQESLLRLPDSSTKKLGQAQHMDFLMIRSEPVGLRNVGLLVMGESSVVGGGMNTLRCIHIRC